MICEVPFALLIKRIGFHLVPISYVVPHLCAPNLNSLHSCLRSIVAFGAVTIASAFIHNKAGFYATRVFLGISEAVCYPGIRYVVDGWTYQFNCIARSTS